VSLNYQSQTEKIGVKQVHLNRDEAHDYLIWQMQCRLAKLRVKEAASSILVTAAAILKYS
jgi:hypothetical protein